MKGKDVFVGDSGLKFPEKKVEGEIVNFDNEQFFRLKNYDAMPPFLMSIVSDSNHWMFISSTGGLTAGRKNSDHAIFPYYTDDKVHESFESTGSKSIIRIEKKDKILLWEPFSNQYRGSYRIERNLYGNHS